MMSFLGEGGFSDLGSIGTNVSGFRLFVLSRGCPVPSVFGFLEGLRSLHSHSITREGDSGGDGQGDVISFFGLRAGPGRRVLSSVFGSMVRAVSALRSLFVGRAPGGVVPGG